MTISRTLTPHARTRFENLAPKYLYQEIFVNFCLLLISVDNSFLTKGCQRTAASKGFQAARGGKIAKAAQNITTPHSALHL